MKRVFWVFAVISILINFVLYSQSAGRISAAPEF